MAFHTGLTGPSDSLSFSDDSWPSFVDEDQEQQSKASCLSHRSGMYA